jgi:DNA-directed RNA polymerase omega subunit
LDAYGNIDSKYRFIILAAKRAKQLLKGAKPKIQGKSKSLIRIAQSEVRNGLIEYEIIPTRMDDVAEREERVFVGEGLGDESGDAEVLSGKDLPDEDVDPETDEGAEEDEGGDEDASDEDGVAKDEKDE